jgi:hypothetical protein
MTDNDLRALCAVAGIGADEIRHDPTHGICLTLSAVRKLAALSPNQQAAAALVRECSDTAARMRRRAFKVVQS